VIPRYIDIAKQNMLSRLLPEFVGQFFVKYERTMAMLHTVPDILAGHKDSVAVFEKYWNEYVSPGKAMYAHRDDSRELIRQARQNAQVSQASIRTKEVFLTSESGPGGTGSSATSPPSVARPSTSSPEPAPAQPVPDEQPDTPQGTRRAVNSSRARRASDGRGSRARRAND
jgi:hypothetical protein